MRIISGKSKGVRLLSPSGNSIRPTSDRVKESMFNIISEKCTGSVVLDLFSGSGSIGLEFISRGAKKVFFVDSGSESIRVIKEYIKKCRMENSSEVINSDYKKALNYLKRTGVTVDIIYADPPYDRISYKEILEEILNSEILKNRGIIIAESDSEMIIEPEGYKLVKYDMRKYGNTKLHFFTTEG